MNFAKKFAAAALIVSSLVFTGCGQGQIGCVDKDKVMAEAPRAKAVTEEAKAEIDKTIAAFDEKYPDKENMSAEDAAKAQMELQRDLQKINQKYSAQLESRFSVVVAEIANSKNIDVVIANSEDQKLLFQGGIDITSEVISKMQ